MANITCTRCEGSGEITIYVTSPEGNGHVDIGCIYCNKTGEMTQEQADTLEASKKIWCECDQENGVDYQPDSEGIKHHWTCNSCFKVVQIG